MVRHSPHLKFIGRNEGQFDAGEERQSGVEEELLLLLTNSNVMA